MPRFIDIEGGTEIAAALDARTAIGASERFYNNVKDYGGVGDGVTDDTTAIQAAVDAADAAGGGTVLLPAGTWLISQSIVLDSGVRVSGINPTASVVKLADGANCNAFESARLATLEDSNLWRVSQGVPTGFGVEHLRINGNKSNNSSGNGIRFYGKHLHIYDVVIYDCAENGVYTDCAYAGGQDDWYDMPEGIIDLVDIRTCDGDGILYRGPHDGRLGAIITAVNGGRGFATEESDGTGGHYYSGMCDLNRIHSYSNTGDGIYIGTSFNATHVETESNYSRGILIDSGNVRIGSLYAYSNWRTYDDVGAGSNVMVEIIDSPTIINMARIVLQYGGTGVKMAGGPSGTVIGSMVVFGSDTFECIGLHLASNQNLVSNAIIDGCSAAGSVGMKVDNSLYAQRINLTTRSCAKHIEHVGAGGNIWDVHAVGYVDSGEVGVTSQGVVGRMPTVGVGVIDYQFIGAGTGMVRSLETATLDFPSVSAQSYQDLTISVTGAVLGDCVALGVPTAAVTAGIAYTAWVSATNTVTVRAHNYTAGALDPGSGTFKVKVVR